MSIITRNNDGGWTVSGKLDAAEQKTAFEAIVRFGYLVPRGTELTGESMAVTIRTHHSDQASWKVAAELEMLDEGDRL